jgi:hypothetical protein
MVKLEPLPFRRGLAVRENSGQSGHVYFALASIDVAVAVYAKLMRPLSWDRGVYGQKRSGHGEIFYQFKGHPWTGATSLGEPGTFSKQLGGRVFVYGEPDRAGVTHHHLYDSGTLIEQYTFVFEERPPWSFMSRARDVGRAMATHPYDFIDATCRWLDLYAEWPPINYCDEEGQVGCQTIVVSDPRYSREDFERVDWVVRDPRPWPERRRDW